MSDELELATGPSGWLQAIVAGLHCFIRLDRSGGQWQAIALFVLSPTNDGVRAIPLRRIELAVNASDALSDALTARLKDRLPGELGTGEFLKAFDGYMHTEPITLKRPAGKRLTDAWYQEVATVYRAAVARNLNPRTTIAEAAGVSTDVAGRWVYEARKRHHLPPARPGKVSV